MNEFFSFGALCLTGVFVIAIMITEDFVSKRK